LNHDIVLILDFGSQFTQLIARRIREQGVYCEIRPCTDTPQSAGVVRHERELHWLERRLCGVVLGLRPRRTPL
jgi:hypothetical protein